MERETGRLLIKSPEFAGDCAVGEITGKLAPQLREKDTRYMPVLEGTPRVQRLRLNYLKRKVTLCIHHAKVFTRVYKET